MISITALGGGRYRLEAACEVAAPLDEVFPFFADAGNLQRITPPLLHFEILTPRPLEMGVGAMIDYKLRVRGLPMRWRSEITAWDPPHRFVDEQRKGPYRFWIHEHTFEDRGGRTALRDSVEYGVPGGALVHKLFVGPDVRKIFAYRTRVMQELFGA